MISLCAVGLSRAVIRPAVTAARSIAGNKFSYTAPQNLRLFRVTPQRFASQVPPPRASADMAQAPAAAATNFDVTGDMLQPSVANKNWVRLIALSGVVAAAAAGTSYLPATANSFVHLVAYSAWMGSSIWTTFFAGLTMFKNMPRQMFGKVQSKLFPLYFGLHSAAITVCLGSMAYGTGSIGQTQMITLGSALGASLLNFLFIEPAATKVMFERYALENAPSRDEVKIKALYKKFGKWHGISSLVNLVALGGAVAHGWWLASKLGL